MNYVQLYSIFTNYDCNVFSEKSRDYSNWKRKFLFGTTVNTATSEYAEYNIKSKTRCIWNCNLILSSAIKSVSAPMYNTESVIWTTMGGQQRCQILLYHTELEIICGQCTYHAPQLISTFNFSFPPNFKLTRPPYVLIGIEMFFKVKRLTSYLKCWDSTCVVGCTDNCVSDLGEQSYEVKAPSALVASCILYPVPERKGTKLLHDVYNAEREWQKSMR